MKNIFLTLFLILSLFSSLSYCGTDTDDAILDFQTVKDDTLQEDKLFFKTSTGADGVALGDLEAGTDPAMQEFDIYLKYDSGDLNTLYIKFEERSSGSGDLKNGSASIPVSYAYYNVPDEKETAIDFSNPEDIEITWSENDGKDAIGKFRVDPGQVASDQKSGSYTAELKVTLTAK